MSDGLRPRIAKALIAVSTDSGADDSVDNVLVIPLRESLEVIYRAIWPEQPEPPGARLKQILADSGVSQAAFARALGVSAKHLCQLISGRASLSHGVALRLETATGIRSAEWNIAEAAWRDHLLRQQIAEIANS